MNPVIGLLAIAPYVALFFAATERPKEYPPSAEYEKWVSQQNLIQEQYQQGKEMLATGSVGSIPEKSVKWLKYKCDCHKGQFSAKQDPNWGDGYFILYCKGATK
jgi:hypothetical protein